MISTEFFRQSFPMFGEEQFPDGRVAFWLSMAGKLLPVERWGDLRTEGIHLYAAHHLTLERAAGLTADGTGGMAVAGGPVTAESKTVGGISLSVTRSSGAASANLNAGHWNDTMYGKQFWQLAQIVGAGGVQV